MPSKKSGNKQNGWCKHLADYSARLTSMLPVGRWTLPSSDLNDLYRRVINRNNRLARLLELNAPGIIIANESGLQKRLMLIDNGRRGRLLLDRSRHSNHWATCSKQDVFVKTCFRKRVDFSGRWLCGRSDASRCTVWCAVENGYWTLQTICREIVARDIVQKCQKLLNAWWNGMMMNASGIFFRRCD